jgi:uncharacterized glyoxalase superfamily protein PhnB
MKNRSVPTDIVMPHVVYEDVARAIEWLTATFGFEEHYHYGEPAQGAQMRAGRGWLMLTSARPGRTTPGKSGAWTQCLTVFVDDVDVHYENAKAAGAKISEELNEPAYGERQYGAIDLEGHLWLFSRHVKDVDPAEWGAVVKRKPGARSQEPE